jgi:DNA-binding NarL/FixJ family response regulator
VIVVTADIQTPSRDAAYASGAAAFITKPVDADELMDAIDSAVGSQR